MAGFVKLLRNQAPVPNQGGIQLGYLRDVLQRLPCKPHGNLGRGHRQMAPQNTILGDQVLVAQQQFLLDETRYERQEPCPMLSKAKAFCPPRIGAVQ